MPIGTILAIAGPIIGGLLSSSGSQDAANAQAGAANQATQEQSREFNILQSLFGPQRNLGYGAMNQLSALNGFPNIFSGSSQYPTFQSPFGPQNGNGFMGNTALSNFGNGSEFGNGFGVIQGNQKIGGSGGLLSSATGPASRAVPSGSGIPNYSGFFNSPGFQFSLGLGNQGVERAASANGGLYTPNTLGAIGQYDIGLASTHYNDYVNQLLQMAGLGSAATSGTANAAMSTGQNIMGNILSAGNANASGIQGSANSWNNAIGQIPWRQIFGGGGGTNDGTIPVDSSGIPTV